MAYDAAIVAARHAAARLRLEHLEADSRRRELDGDELTCRSDILREAREHHEGVRERARQRRERDEADEWRQLHTGLIRWDGTPEVFYAARPGPDLAEPRSVSASYLTGYSSNWTAPCLRFWRNKLAAPLRWDRWGNEVTSRLWEVTAAELRIRERREAWARDFAETPGDAAKRVVQLEEDLLGVGRSPRDFLLYRNMWHDETMLRYEAEYRLSQVRERRAVTPSPDPTGEKGARRRYAAGLRAARAAAGNPLSALDEEQLCAWAPSSDSEAVEASNAGDTSDAASVKDSRFQPQILSSGGSDKGSGGRAYEHANDCE
eukprot:gene3072-2904_t